MLNLACRHHVIKLILASAFNITFSDAASGPDVQLFKRFQKKWPTFTKANAMIINDPRLADQDEWKRTTLETLAKAAATTRDDYKEIAELTAKSIKGEVPPPSANKVLTATEMGGKGDLYAQDGSVPERVRSKPGELSHLDLCPCLVRGSLGRRRSFQRSFSSMISASTESSTHRSRIPR